MLDADVAVADETKYAIAAALLSDQHLAEQLRSSISAAQRPTGSLQPAPRPATAFLASISVEGFRGIGSRATLQLDPYYGLTVISGRNGSGKSSFAEALELALTGESYRFEKKAQHWQDSWRNIHNPQSAAIELTFAMEPDDGREGRALRAGAQWTSDAGLKDCQRWSQIHGHKRETIRALGWEQALITHRPLMSYDELGGLLETSPSTLHDALYKLLGLEEITDAEQRLKGVESSLGHQRKNADAGRKRLLELLTSVSDPRAEHVRKLVARKPYDVDAVLATTLGAQTGQAETIARLRTIAALEVPNPAGAFAVAEELRGALGAQSASVDSATDALLAQAEILKAALGLHSGSGTGPCPVCQIGTLDDAWAQAAEGRLQEAEAAVAEQRQLSARLNRARQAATGFFDTVPSISAVGGIDLTALSDYTHALVLARDSPTSLSDLPTHVESSAGMLAEAAAALAAEAGKYAAELEDAWTPVAAAISAWVTLERDARATDETLRCVKDARKWLTDSSQTLRRRRLEPVVDQARDIWRRMRQESNVDLGDIRLEGTGTRRKVVLKGSVDGVPSGVLSVMSQGELHALALALFIPRATSPGSPFRFVVLDDPIQAMDPAKIGGFLDVLIALAEDRQVIVFSHDDRLPAAIRARSIPARLLEVRRESESHVVVKSNGIPADRYIEDAEALIRDERLDEVIKSKAGPGLFRMAIEAAAYQRFFTDRAGAGVAYHESDRQWGATQRTRSRVELAIDVGGQDGFRRWEGQRPYRRRILNICAGGSHVGAALHKQDIGDLRQTVRDIVEDR